MVAENINRNTTDQSDAGTARTNLGTGTSGTSDFNRTTMSQPDVSGTRSTNVGNGKPTGISGQTKTPQTEGTTSDQDMNSTFSRALIGGLIGGTLGSLAGALAGRQIGEGFNHTWQGLGEAARIIAEGLGHTAKGVGHAVKSVAEGTSYAVVGGTSDTVQGVREGLRQTAASAVDAVQRTTQSFNQGVQDVAEGTKEQVETSRPETQGNQYQDRSFAQNQQSRSTDIGRGQQDTASSVYISAPDWTDTTMSERTTPINEGTSTGS